LKESHFTKLKKISIIGESCLDLFVYCDAIRLAPDLPVPVLQIQSTVTNSGMAANVYNNIKSIYSKCEIITNKNWESVTKTRYVHEATNHTFFRVDTPHIIEPLQINELKLDCEILIISDYDKGFLSRETIEVLTKKAEIVFLDTKKKLGEWASGATFIKINKYEYERSLPINNKTLADKLIVTKGNEGAIFQNNSYPVDKVEIKDTSGAGDSFLAALVTAFAKSGDINDSIVKANKAASEVVRHRGVVTIG
jgi:bifunctional ADP-heptose synthase (sugar kinase/adenylyltransferase)